MTLLHAGKSMQSQVAQSLLEGVAITSYLLKGRFLHVQHIHVMLTEATHPESSISSDEPFGGFQFLDGVGSSGGKVVHGVPRQTLQSTWCQHHQPTTTTTAHEATKKQKG